MRIRAVGDQSTVDWVNNGEVVVGHGQRTRFVANRVRLIDTDHRISKQVGNRNVVIRKVRARRVLDIEKRFHGGDSGVHGLKRAGVEVYGGRTG